MYVLKSSYKLRFGVLAGIYIYYRDFSPWERLGYKQPPLCEFLDSDISEIRPTATKSMVATADQLTIAKR